MPLVSGTRLGPYEVLAPLGAGGMGEVYRARDARIERSVAIKVLAEGVAHSSESRARLDREARSIAALNHPNIGALNDVGHQDVTRTIWCSN
jgi:serine/threonine protein kinase